MKTSGSNGFLSAFRPTALPALLAASCTMVATHSVSALTTVNKAATGTDLTAGASWGGTAPGVLDAATWSGSALGAGLTLGTSTVSWGGISVSGAASDIDIAGGSTGILTLGTGGIDLSTSTVNLKLVKNVTLGANQAWNVALGKTLTIGSAPLSSQSIVFNSKILTVGGAGDTVLNMYGGDNAGTLTKTGSGTLTTTSNPRLLNATVNVQGGVLSVQAAQLFTYKTDTSSTLNISGGGVLELQNWHKYSAGDTTGNLGSLREASAAIVIDGGTIRMNNGGTATSNGRGFTVNAGGATLEANGTALWTLGSTTACVYNSNPSLTFAGTGLGQFDKAFSGSGALTKSGTGTWTLTGANNHTGATTIKGGTLKLTGGGGIASSTSIVVGDTGSSGAVLDVTGITGGTFTVGGSQTLSGIGTVNAAGKSVAVSSSIAPGNSAGLLSVSTNALQLASTSVLSIEMTRNVSPTAGSNYDQLGLTGTLDLASGAALNLTALGTGSWTLNDIYFLVANDGTDAITGTFTGFGEGVTILFDSTQFKVTYLANSVGNSFSGGNDFALQVIPEPGAALLGGLGLLALLRRRRS